MPVPERPACPGCQTIMIPTPRGWHCPHPNCAIEHWNAAGLPHTGQFLEKAPAAPRRPRNRGFKALEGR